MGTFGEILTRSYRATPDSSGVLRGLTDRSRDVRQVADDLSQIGLSSFEPKEFTTGYGSRYFILPDQTTVRNKALRAHHPGDSGWKDPSNITVYSSTDGADRLMSDLYSIDPKVSEDAKKSLVLSSRGNAAVMWRDGPLAGSPVGKSVPVFRQPEESQTPIEFFGDSAWRTHGDPAWRGDEGHGVIAHRTHHFGNPVMSIQPSPDWYKHVQLEPEELDFQRALLDRLRLQGSRP